MITIDRVRWEVQRIREVAHDQNDEETAHQREDALFVKVLRAIAAGEGDAKALAQEALATRDISFARWCA